MMKSKLPHRDWDKIFAACDQAGFEDLLQARDQGEYESRSLSIRKPRESLKSRLRTN